MRISDWSSDVCSSDLTTLMAQDYVGRCRVNAVAPGITLPSGGQSKEEFEMVARHNLLRRASSPQHVTGAVRMLLSNTAINGQCIWVDGGQRFVAQPRDVMRSEEHTSELQSLMRI